MKKLLLATKDIRILAIGILLLSLGQLQRMTTLFGVHYAFEPLLLVFIFGKRTLFFHKVQEYWKKASVSKKTLAFLIVGGVLINWLITNDPRGALLTLRATLYLSCAWLVHLSTSDKQKQTLRLLLLVTGLVVALSGLLQYLFLPDMRFLAALGWDDHYYRALGTLLDPNYLGIFLILTLANLWSWGKQIPAKLVVLFTTLLSITIAATFSRATYLSTIVLFAAQFLYKKAVGFVALAVVVVILLLPKPTGEGVDLMRTSTIMSRITQDKMIVTNSLESPWRVIFGAGLFSATHESTAVDTTTDHGLHPNNIFILIYHGIGALGLVLLLPSVLRGFKRVYRAERIMAVGLLALFVHAMFNNSFFEPILLLFWSLNVATIKTRL